MGKVVFWLVIAFAILFGVRLVNAAKARRRTGAARGRPASAAETMVRCVRCGVFLPRSDAAPAPGGYRCADGTGCSVRH
jgi:hypothetical protein